MLPLPPLDPVVVGCSNAFAPGHSIFSNPMRNKQRGLWEGKGSCNKGSRSRTRQRASTWVKLLRDQLSSSAERDRDRSHYAVRLSSSRPSSSIPSNNNHCVQESGDCPPDQHKIASVQESPGLIVRPGEASSSDPVDCDLVGPPVVCMSDAVDEFQEIAGAELESIAE